MVFPVARYTLIMKDETYVKLVNQAKIEGISVGKLINKILNEWAEGAGKAGRLPLTQKPSSKNGWMEATSN